MQYESFELSNGLRVIVHEDHSTKTAVLNLLYNVGSRDEDPNKTGFAHLFEHLMFGGSKNIGSFDEPLQKVGGENNAFTSPDITNYYITIPSNNLETAFWLESDRMLSLSFDKKVLEVQRKVVIEEFKQRYLNQPYGDVWLKLRPLAYHHHPYQWATIGKDISHIEDATMDDVKAFFGKFYIPNNAILVVSGDVTVSQVEKLSKKWFGPISAGKPYVRHLPTEPHQDVSRFLHLEGNVPLNAIYQAYHMPGRMDQGYHSTDLLSDILGRGKSSKLYAKLVKQDKVFSKVDAHVTGSIDPGLLVISGNLLEGVSFEEAESGIRTILDDIMTSGIEEQELSKVQMQSESSHTFGSLELLNRSIELAVATLLGNTEMVNEEIHQIQSVTVSDINDMAKKVLRENNASILRYQVKETLA